MKIKLLMSKKEDYNKSKILISFIFSLVVVGSTFAQSGKFSFQFNTDGNKEGWVSTHNSTSIVAGGAMKVAFDPAQFPDPLKRRADFQHTGGMTVNPAYPIIAIKFNKPATVNITLDTNLGKYKNNQNNWSGKVGADIYYYDISTGSFGSPAVLISAETALTIFQWKIADISSAETDYSVDWVASFASVAELNATLGVNTNNIEKNIFSIYPNPSTEKFFNIDLNGYTNDRAVVKVYNLLGNLVLEKTLNTSYTRVDHNLGTGVYIVKVDNNTTKLIVN